jgi:hypothetical protein
MSTWSFRFIWRRTITKLPGTNPGHSPDPVAILFLHFLHKVKKALWAYSENLVKRYEKNTRYCPTGQDPSESFKGSGPIRPDPTTPIQDPDQLAEYPEYSEYHKYSKCPNTPNTQNTPSIPSTPSTPSTPNTPSTPSTPSTPNTPSGVGIDSLWSLIARTSCDQVIT